MSRSEMNTLHCSFPKDLIWRILDTADFSAITFKREEITIFF